ncbi:MAG: helix-turn-helix domain-containing protein [Lachnospirales bacterium]
MISNISRLNRGKKVAITVLMRLCDYFDRDIEDSYEVLREE